MKLETNPPTIRETESTKLEKIKKSRSELAREQMYRFPSYGNKRIKSKSQLRKAIAEFFKEYDTRVIEKGRKSNDQTKALALPSDLAMFLGYASYRQMAYEINNPIDPEYSSILSSAVDYINGNIQRTQLALALKVGDVKGVDNVAKYYDKINDSTIAKTDSKTEVNIQINLESKKRVDAYVDERMEKLMASIKTVANTVQETEDVEYRDI